MSAYRALARVYDEFNESAGCEKLCALADAVFKTHANKIVLDAGCGTGALSVMLARLGFEVIGADISEAMLALAQQKAAEAGVSVLFILQDICELDLYGTVGGVLCARDTLNHIEPKRLPEALRRLALFLEEGGALIFDVNTVYKHAKVLADNSFVYESASSLVAWRNCYSPDEKRVALAVDVFTETESGLYERGSDEFFEYDTDPEELAALIEANGMRVERILDGEDFGDPRESSERLIFICRKG